VAKESGLSRRTIDRVMKGQNVRPATIAMIRKAINYGREWQRRDAQAEDG
jgi:DNA-binding LacI/PurR family transcriptional regulator